MHEPLRRYYQEMLRRFGPRDPRALAWRDAKSQNMRFSVLCDIADLTGASILDEGCGLGDLYPYLLERFGHVSYTGIDINEQLIAAAHAKYPDGHFAAADFSTYHGTEFEYVLASGTLTFKIPNYREVYFDHIRKMVQIARKGVAFNMLDQNAFLGNDLYATYDPYEVETYCRTLAEKVTLRRDYSGEDFTLYVYK